MKLAACVVINMDRDTERLAHMESACAKAGLSFTRFAAIGGANLPEALRRYFAEPGATDSVLSPGETGCYASHLAICRQIASGEIATPALVLEDDVELPENFSDFLDSLLGHLPTNWDIVRLSNDAKRVAMPVAALSPPYSLVRYSSIPGSTGALLWSEAGARKFLAEQRRIQPVDQDLRRAWRWNLETYGVLPAPVRRDIFDVSTIDAMTSHGWRGKGARQARLRAIRTQDAGAGFTHGARVFGWPRWLYAGAMNVCVKILPKKMRTDFLRNANARLAKR